MASGFPGWEGGLYFNGPIPRHFFQITFFQQQAPPSRLIPLPCWAPITVSWPGVLDIRQSYHSQFAVVGTVANTTVTITPSTNAGLAGSMWTNSFILNQGDTYQINSSNIEGDVTGTWITSDKPSRSLPAQNLLMCPANTLKLQIR